MRNFKGNQNVSGAVDVSNITLDILTIGLAKTLAPQVCGILAKGFVLIRHNLIRFEKGMAAVHFITKPRRPNTGNSTQGQPYFLQYVSVLYVRLTFVSETNFLLRVSGFVRYE